MIDHVIIPNLDRRLDKWAYMLGALDHAGFPIRDEERIIRFSSHDGNDYNDSIEVCNAAIDDGFDFFEETKRHFSKISKSKDDPRNYTAWLWTWASILREIINIKDKTYMFMIDDIVPISNWHWGRFCNLVGDIVNLEGSFRAIQLCYPLGQCQLDWTKNDHTAIVGKGFTGQNDLALILNGEGATLLAEMQRQRSERHPAIHMTMIRNLEHKDPKKYQEGLWHTLDSVMQSGYYQDSSDLGPS